MQLTAAAPINIFGHTVAMMLIFIVYVGEDQLFPTMVPGTEFLVPLFFAVRVTHAGEEVGVSELSKMRPDQSKDYFAVLGVTPQADPAVMKAAYRALAKKYHPDHHTDSVGPAREKFLEVQEAYELLSDEEQLANYMHMRTRMQNEEAAAAMRNQRPTVYLRLDDRWDHLVREYPDLRQYHARFCLTSPKLGQQFKLIILGTSNKSSYRKIATRMKRQFYRRYFSYHRDLQTLARRLAGKRRRHALRELSREINGRRLLSRSYRRTLLNRYESRYLKPNAQSGGGYRPLQFSLPGVPPGANARQPPPRATKIPTLFRVAAWFSMGVALFTNTMSF